MTRSLLVLLAVRLLMPLSSIPYAREGLLRYALGFSLIAALSVTTAQNASSQVCTPRTDESFLALDFEPVLSGFERPTSVTSAGDGSERLFVTEKAGRVRIVRGAQLLPEPFLDIQSRVTTEGEQGLLSVAFHPDYRRNGRLFVSYNMPLEEGSRSVVAEYRVDPTNPDRALPRERVILTLAQPNLPIHKGGQLQFGPDGYLYLSFGDGDQPIEAQELDSLYGKILRLDIDAPEVPYAIPPDNPFVAQNGAKGEIWAYGLRNPWRFSLDPCTSELFVGDVGLSIYEEVNLIEPGHNYGWPIAQVDLCGRPVVLGSVSCEGLGLALPIHSYRHLNLDEEGGNSVIGGYVYRGQRFPQLRGRYLFTDLVSTKIWSLTRDASGKWRRDTLGQGSELLSALGLDEAGELFALGYQEGTLYRLDREEIDFAEGNLERTATPKTIALKNLSAPGR